MFPIPEGANPSLAYMIQRLSGNERSVDAYEKSLGKQIASLSIIEDTQVIRRLDCSGVLRFVFTDGSVLDVYDGGQSCCEARYLHTDDDLAYFAGATLTGINVAKMSDSQDDYDTYHEIAFLHIETSLGVFTLETHNEHNGYYGGFVVLFNYKDKE